MLSVYNNWPGREATSQRFYNVLEVGDKEKLFPILFAMTFISIISYASMVAQ